MILFALLADQISYGSSFLFIAASAAVVAYLLIRRIPETGQAAAEQPRLERSGAAGTVSRPDADPWSKA